MEKIKEFVEKGPEKEEVSHNRSTMEAKNVFEGRESQFRWMAMCGLVR